MPTPLRRLARVSLLAGLVALLGLCGLAASAGAGECARTWLPDLDCDRQARPAGFVAPMSMPYLFEDPFITTELQLVGIWHDFPEDSIFDGGDVGVIALQARLALTERLAFIATKDGVTFFRPKLAILRDEEDIMDVTVGFKYALLQGESYVVTPSLRYEIPLGSHRLFQGQGDGVLIPAASAAWGRGPFHTIASLGAQIPFDGDLDSTSIFYNLHLDWGLHEHFVPFIELNGMHWTDSGDGSAKVRTTTLGFVPLSAAQAVLGTGGFEGADVANLGSQGVAGNDLVTMAWGARFPLDAHASLGLSYERAISKRKDIFEQRLTTMVTYVF